jgi:hypothetical protein
MLGMRIDQVRIEAIPTANARGAGAKWPIPEAEADSADELGGVFTPSSCPDLNSNTFCGYCRAGKMLANIMNRNAHNEHDILVSCMQILREYK